MKLADYISPLKEGDLVVVKDEHSVSPTVYKIYKLEFDTEHAFLVPAHKITNARTIVKEGKRTPLGCLRLPEPEELI